MSPGISGAELSSCDQDYRPSRVDLDQLANIGKSSSPNLNFPNEYTWVQKCGSPQINSQFQGENVVEEPI